MQPASKAHSEFPEPVRFRSLWYHNFSSLIEDTMHSNRQFRFRIFYLILPILFMPLVGFAGVSRAIQEQYKREYENKAMFLKIPIYSERQMISISGQSFRVDQGIGAPKYKVGDQLRILQIDFAGEEIKIRTSGIAAAGTVELIYRFDTNLQEAFPNRDVFDRALKSTFTEGLKYTEIDDAKRSFVEEQFDQSIKEIASSASISRESVLKNVAPRIPAYQEAQRENDNLRSRVQDISSQLSQAQSENRKLESESKTQQAELSRLKNANTALQEKIENSTLQMSKLGDDLRDAKGNALGYQKELANIQRSLNLKVDTARDLTAQIADLGQALRKLQKENESLSNQVNSLHASLDAQQAANGRLVRDNEGMKADNKKLQNTLTILTSKEDSLAKRYLNLSNEKDRLENFHRSIEALRTRIEDEKTEGGFYSGKANLFLKDVLLGFLSWRIPMYLNHDESGEGEVTFSAESIDYIRLSPEERSLLNTFGDNRKLRVELASDSKTVIVTPSADKASREIRERDHATWQWTIKNEGTRDVPLILIVRLINKNSTEIPIFQRQNTVIASNAVRRIRGYLQPIPLAVGMLLGFLLFGIVGVFRRSKNKSVHSKSSPPPAPSAPQTYIEKKQL
jgi:predicted nuclease with TOPRIM domain